MSVRPRSASFPWCTTSDAGGNLAETGEALGGRAQCRVVRPASPAPRSPPRPPARAAGASGTTRRSAFGVREGIPAHPHQPEHDTEDDHERLPDEHVGDGKPRRPEDPDVEERDDPDDVEHLDRGETENDPDDLAAPRAPGNATTPETKIRIASSPLQPLKIATENRGEREHLAGRRSRPRRRG